MAAMTDLPERAGRAELRPSDRDREQVAELLREATAQGRIDDAEFDDRLAAAYAARTYATLDVLTRDLPAAAAERPADQPAEDRRGSGPESGLAFSLFSGFARKGAWTVPRVLSAVCLCGGGLLDLSQARFTHEDTRIRAFALCGGMKILLPDDVDADVNGLGLMGLFTRKANGPGAPGAPRVTVRGFALFGGIITKRASED
jgi:Domain of unknown function (DUF1707)